MDEIEIPFKKRTTPYLSIPVNEVLWLRVEGTDGLWTLNNSHDYFSEGMPYYGVVHAEVSLKEAGESLINLALETDEGHEVFVFGFGKNGGAKFFNSPRNKNEFIKVLKIASELVCHLPDDAVREDLKKKLEWEIKSKEPSVKTLWERI